MTEIIPISPEIKELAKGVPFNIYYLQKCYDLYDVSISELQEACVTSRAYDTELSKECFSIMTAKRKP